MKKIIYKKEKRKREQIIKQIKKKIKTNKNNNEINSLQIATTPSLNPTINRERSTQQVQRGHLDPGRAG